jgi:Ras-related protein Rab-1A
LKGKNIITKIQRDLYSYVLIYRFANAGVCKILVGNKCDLEELRKVSFEEGLELAKHYEIPFLETSAKNSVNVESSFVTMSKEIKKNI